MCAILAAFALTTCARGASSTSPGGEPQTAQVGRPAPLWSERSLPGPTLAFASLHGKAVYLNFFATWCPPCNAEAPAINALQSEYGGRGLQVVGVDVLENAGKAAEFRNAHHLAYPVVIDTGTLRDQYRINGLPVHVFIDRNGVVSKIVAGELSSADMRGDVERILR